MTCIAACGKEQSSVYDIMLCEALTSYLGDKSVNSSKITGFVYPECTTRNSDVGGVISKSHEVPR